MRGADRGAGRVSAVRLASILNVINLQMRITSWGEVVLDKRQLKSVMRAAGNDVAKKTQRLISQTTGSGRQYGRRYRASAPGQPPIMRTGALRNSMKVYVFGDGAGFAVRERQFYSLFLEVGARGGGRGRATRRVLLPRPHLDLVMQQQAPEIDRRVRRAITEGLTWRQTK
jgi:hypothetical protein